MQRKGPYLFLKFVTSAREVKSETIFLKIMKKKFVVEGLWIFNLFHLRLFQEITF